MIAHPKHMCRGGMKQLANKGVLSALAMIAGWFAQASAAESPAPYAYLPSGFRDAAIASDVSWTTPEVKQSLTTWRMASKMMSHLLQTGTGPGLGPQGGDSLFTVPSKNPSKVPLRDPKNFQGIWQADTLHAILEPTEGAGANGLPPYRPDAEKITMYALKMNTVGTPVAYPLIYCRPIGPEHISLDTQPFQIFQDKDTLWRTYNGAYSQVDVVHLNAEHPKQLKPSYEGHSVGHWEGNTLVIDTIGYTDKTVLDMAGSPNSEKLHLVERYTKSEDGSYVDYAATFDDPVYYTQPFTVKFKYLWNPDANIPVLPCEENPRTVIVKNIYYNGVRPPKFKPKESSTATGAKP